MSWFPDEFEECRLPDDGGRDEAPTAGTEVAPGVVVERSGVFRLGRRRLMGVSGAAAALVATRGVVPRTASEQDAAGTAAPPTTELGPLTLDEFKVQAERLAEELVRTKGEQEDAYLHQLASMLCRLSATPSFDRVSDRPFQMKGEHRSANFAIMQIKMKAGAALPFHDHYEYNGVIIGLEGAVRTRSYEMVDGDPRPPADEPFLIRETVDTLLTPGRVSTLSRRRDNIHDLRAGKDGARVLDVFTFFPKRQGSREMIVEPKPIDEAGRVYRARWKPRRRR